MHGPSPAYPWSRAIEPSPRAWGQSREPLSITPNCPTSVPLSPRPLTSCPCQPGWGQPLAAGAGRRWQRDSPALPASGGSAHARGEREMPVSPHCPLPPSATPHHGPHSQRQWHPGGPHGHRAAARWRHSPRRLQGGRVNTGGWLSWGGPGGPPPYKPSVLPRPSQPGLGTPSTHQPSAGGFGSAHPHGSRWHHTGGGMTMGRDPH